MELLGKLATELGGVLATVGAMLPYLAGYVLLILLMMTASAVA